MARAGQRGMPRAGTSPRSHSPTFVPYRSLGGRADVPHRPGARVSRPGPGMAGQLAAPTEGRPVLSLHIVESLA